MSRAWVTRKSEDRSEDPYRLLDTSQIEDQEGCNDDEFHLELVAGNRGKKAEYLIAAAGDRDRDREHIVHEQGCTGDHAEMDRGVQWRRCTRRRRMESA
jgi:hypothetical protein